MPAHGRGREVLCAEGKQQRALKTDSLLTRTHMHVMCLVHACDVPGAPRKARSRLARRGLCRRAAAGMRPMCLHVYTCLPMRGRGLPAGCAVSCTPSGSAGSCRTVLPPPPFPPARAQDQGLVLSVGLHCRLHGRLHCRLQGSAGHAKHTMMMMMHHQAGTTMLMHGAGRCTIWPAGGCSLASRQAS